jgi:hypothetical protein
MAVIADFEQYPEWVDWIKSAHALNGLKRGSKTD